MIERFTTLFIVIALSVTIGCIVMLVAIVLMGRSGLLQVGLARGVAGGSDAIWACLTGLCGLPGIGLA